MTHAHRSGFTLIELLVVITIIVVLLALLTPALDRALYQAELTQDGANLRATSTAILQYAFGNKRYYPDRKLRDLQPNSTVTWVPPMALAHPHDGYDMRPPLREYLVINKMLQCPFTEQLELDDTPPDVSVEASYAMWWGWKYHTKNGGQERGMFKIGDRFAWDGSNFNILIGDIDLRYPDSSQASHPDRDPAKMALVVAEDDLIFYTRARVSRWLYRENRQRGLIDTNFAMDDGSSQRFTDVKHMIRAYGKRHPGMDWVPIQFDQRRQGDALQIPVQ